MAITDLTGYTWVANNTLFFEIRRTYAVNFYDVSTNSYTQMAWFMWSPNFLLHYDSDAVYGNGSWRNEADKTITITGGADATNPDLISLLEANGTLTKGGGSGSTIDVTYNGTKIIDSLEVTPPVEVTYNGSTIATLNAGDTKTLQCNGKVMASDVVIGDKTLQCGGKLMASDVVVEVGG